MNLEQFIRRVQYIDRHQQQIAVRLGFRNHFLSELDEETRFKEAMILAMKPTPPHAIIAPDEPREALDWWTNEAPKE